MLARARSDRRSRGSLVFGRGSHSAGAVGDEGLIFDLPLTVGLTPRIAGGSATPTFTRATAAAVTDFENLIKTALSGEARFTGARRVRNLTPNSTTLSVAAGWTRTGTPTITQGITDPNGGTTAITLTATGAGDEIYKALVDTQIGPMVGAWYIRRRTGTGAVKMYLSGNAPTTITTAITTSWQRISAADTNATLLTSYIGIQIATSGDELDLWRPQSENCTGQTITTIPSEYVSTGSLSAPYHGANVDGVKYFPYENGNTVASNVVTEAYGAYIATATLKKYLPEGARTNLCLQSQTLDNATWVKSNVTVTADEAVAPDGTTTADTLTATAGNGTVIQDLGVVASAARAGGFYLKRKTGTGNIDLTLDGGTTWTTVVLTAAWTRPEITQTLADPDFGIRIVTSGDAVWAWGGQVE